MKTLMSLIMVSLMLVSCGSQETIVQIVSTGEKVKVDNDLYNIGDTVVVCYEHLNWSIDEHWIEFNEPVKCLYDSSYIKCYYKAVVLDPVIEEIEE